MGRVFEARDIALDRAVAIKQSLTDDVQMLVRFEREALITARLQHPGIVPVLDAGRDAEGRPYYVMRKIEGRPLATVVAEARDAGARLALLPNMLAAIDAIAYAHARGVLHRDLKPWNILLGPFGETFVIDWGLARDLAGADMVGGTTISGDDGLTRVGSAMGTPGFMAPEQARGDAIDQRADVYALGATLAHLLVGKQPFAGVDPTLAVETIARNEVPRIEFPEEIMPELRTIAQKAMAADRDARYPDAGALASDLRRFLAGQLVAAHAYTARERLMRWLRKHRLVVAIASIAAIALLVISTIAIRNVVVARDEARAAQQRADDRADQMLVAQADALATTDPAFAIALLKQLPESSRMWLRARVVAETAVAHGVGRGMPAVDAAAYSRIAASPSGDVVAIYSGDTIQLADPSLTSPPRLLIERADGISQFFWFDDDSIVVATDKRVVLRVHRDGTIKTLDAKGTSIALVMEHGDGRIFAKVDGDLRELDPDGGPPRAEIGPVKSVDRVDGALLYSVDDKTLVIAEDGAPLQMLHDVDVAARLFVANLREHRIATYTDKEVVEYERIDGVWKERGRWLVEAAHVLYRNKVLIAIEASGVAYLWPGRPPSREFAAISRDRAITPGAAIATDMGVFVIGDSAIFALASGPVAIAGYADRPSSFAKAGPYLVTMARTGMLRSWDLRRFYPHMASVKNDAHAIAVDTTRAWFQEGHQVVVYDLATHKLERMKGELQAFDHSSVACDGPDFTILKLDEDRRLMQKEPAQAAVRTRDGTITPIAGDYDVAVCTPAQSWLVLKRKSAVEVRDARTPERAGRVFEAPGELRSFGINERWLAMRDTAGGVTRVELASGRVLPAFNVGAGAELAVDLRGRIATTTKDGAVVLWVDGKPRTVADKLEIGMLSGHPFGFLVFTRDRAMITIDHDARVARYDIGEVALSVAWGAYRVAIIIDGKVGILDIRDGSLVRLPWRASSVAISVDGASIAATSRSGQVSILRLEIPSEPRALLRWLDTVTNATLEPGSTELTWKK